MAKKELTKETIQKLYDVEVKDLLRFNKKLEIFFKDAAKNYPSDKTRKLQAISEIITDILSSKEVQPYSSIDQMKEVYKVSEDFINMQDDSNGFDLDDVLNPKDDLDLMELCKELGIE